MSFPPKTELQFNNTPTQTQRSEESDRINLLPEKKGTSQVESV